jgi:hypothetical protein
MMAYISHKGTHKHRMTGNKFAKKIQINFKDLEIVHREKFLMQQPLSFLV